MQVWRLVSEGEEEEEGEEEWEWVIVEIENETHRGLTRSALMIER